jgi:hypothetical protein
MALNDRFTNLTNLEINMDYVSKDEITQIYVTIDLVCEKDKDKIRIYYVVFIICVLVMVANFI